MPDDSIFNILCQMGFKRSFSLPLPESLLVQLSWDTWLGVGAPFVMNDSKRNRMWCIRKKEGGGSKSGFIHVRLLTYIRCSLPTLRFGSYPEKRLFIHLLTYKRLSHQVRAMNLQATPVMLY